MTHTHTHDHEHVHTEDHSHALEGYAVRGGPPVLDIGGDIGAMVVTMPPEALGTELHLRSEHEPPVAVHTGVWGRDHGGRTVPIALFPELLEGGYHVLDGTGTAVRHVEIVGGNVTTIDLTS